MVELGFLKLEIYLGFYKMINRINEILNKYLHEIETLEDIDTTPPKSVQKEAQKVLDWKKKYGFDVKGGTAIGWTRARQLARGDKLSIDTVKRMYTFFSRHKGNEEISPENKGKPWKDAGRTAWLLWGGDAGFRWSRKIVKQLKTLEGKNETMADNKFILRLLDNLVYYRNIDNGFKTLNTLRMSIKLSLLRGYIRGGGDTYKITEKGVKRYRELMGLEDEKD